MKLVKVEKKHMTKETWCIDFSTAVLQTSCFILTSSHSLALFSFFSLQSFFLVSSSLREKKLRISLQSLTQSGQLFVCLIFRTLFIRFFFFLFIQLLLFSFHHSFFSFFFFFVVSSVIRSCMYRFVLHCLVLPCLILFYRLFLCCVSALLCSELLIFFCVWVAVRSDSLWNFVTAGVRVCVCYLSLFHFSHSLLQIIQSHFDKHTP